MKPLPHGRWTKAFTLVELLVVIAIIGLVFALLLPALTGSKARAKRILCVNNLKQTGIAFHSFANDHSGKFPMEVSMNDGGSLEFVAAGYQIHDRFYFAYQHFRPLMGDLVTPALLACPADLQRWPATNFNHFDNHNLSYVVGLKAEPDLPGSILAADRNLPAGSISGYSDIISIPPLGKPYWGFGLHERKGNVLFSDGHVEESGDANASSEQIVAEDLVYPDVPPSTAMASTGGGGGSGVGGFAASSTGVSARPPSHPDFNPPQNDSPVVLSAPNPNLRVGTASASSSGAGHAAPPPATLLAVPANANSKATPPTALRTTNRPAMMSGGSENFGKALSGSSEMDFSSARTQIVSIMSSKSISVAATADESDFRMSPFNRRLAKDLRYSFEWSYLLLLLLLLLYLTYRLWRWWQKKQDEMETARLKRMAQESTLDSDDSIR
jgi:prepilin-type N-terminal cleavage/methylation domain-containing protein/prepilin-type processing-associated H-X9-DG protein